MLLEESRELIEKAEKDNRALTKDEEIRHKQIISETDVLAQRISTLERQLAIETVGPEPTPRRSIPLPHEDERNVGTRYRYSILRAARAKLREINPGLIRGNDEVFDGLEAEVSQEIARRTEKTPQGFFIPHSMAGPEAFRARERIAERAANGERRALESVVAGAGSVPTILDKDWIELLRNAMKVKQAGAREIMDLVGKFAIPRQDAAATAYWVAEGGAPTGTNQTLDQVLFTPKTIGAFTDITRRFFELTILESGEEFVKEDLTAILARGVDLAALNGSGTANTPLGILQNTGITSTRTVSLGANGGPPTWPALVELHTIVQRGNAADLGEFSYMGNADVEGTCATTIKLGSTFPILLLENGKIYGKTLHTTQQLPNNFTKGTGTSLSPIIGGIWNQIILAYWSGIDILVDPYTGSSSGTIRIVALHDMDIQVRHNEAFAVCVDMVSNQTA
jgi:HK97 family phage major capsid protein